MPQSEYLSKTTKLIIARFTSTEVCIESGLPSLVTSLLRTKDSPLPYYVILCVFCAETVIKGLKESDEGVLF